MKIYTNAYLDRNIGDDLMLRLAAQAMPQHCFYVGCADPALLFPFADLKNVIGGAPLLNGKINTNDYDALLTIGGSMYILGSRNSVKYRYKTFYKGNAKFKRAGKKIAVCGCNLGLANSRLANLLINLELKKAGSVTLRDSLSLDIANGAGINASFYPDMLFSLDIPPAKTRDGLGISVYRNIRERGQNFDYCKAVAIAADSYINTTGKPVTLFAFDCETENDLCSVHTVANLMENDVKIVAYTGDYKPVLAAIAGCERFIGTRFHSTIFALSSKTPVLPVIYSKKTVSMLRDIGFDGKSFTVRDICENPERFADEVCGQNAWFTLDDASLAKIKKQSGGHIEKLKNYFNQ
ncbi:MAG: polysaccharide pyruvyl transferase family protein [Clostridia bacterium]|nr:polysaccharide pyruvyl transferase family protein [Clostridia bacterium]